MHRIADLIQADLTKIPRQGWSVWGDVVGDEDLAVIRDTKRINEINIFNGHGITDDGLEDVGTLPDLRVLRVSNCVNISDDGVAKLCSLEKLERLDLLQAHNITPKAVRLISRLHSLHTLNLSGAKSLTDEVVPAIINMKELTHLNLMDTQITSEGVRQIQAALPNINLRADPQIHVHKGPDEPLAAAVVGAILGDDEMPVTRKMKP